MVVGLNKSDLASPAGLARTAAEFRDALGPRRKSGADPDSDPDPDADPDADPDSVAVAPLEVAAFSALTGANVEAPARGGGERGPAGLPGPLLPAVAARLPFGPPLYEEDRITDLPEAFFAAEEVRERMLLHLRQEVPHAAAVRIEEYDDSAPDAGLVRIRASVLVDRDSQRGIVIGRGGSMLKRVGSEARAALESRLGRRVFLGLQVRVRAGWRDNPGILRDLGL